MSVEGQSPLLGCDSQVAALQSTDGFQIESERNPFPGTTMMMMTTEKHATMTTNRDSGCETSSAGTDSPSSYRWIQDDNSTGSYSCSSCEATVDQTSTVYQQLAQTLAQARLTMGSNQDIKGLDSAMIVSESSIALSPINLAESKTGEDNMSIYLATEERDEKKQTPERTGSTTTLGPAFPRSYKMEQANRKSRGRLFPQVLASLALAIAALIEGYSSGYTSPALASMTQANSSIPVNDQQSSWIGSLMPLNALIGGIVGGSIVEKFGRKATIMATGPPYILCKFIIHY